MVSDRRVTVALTTTQVREVLDRALERIQDLANRAGGISGHDAGDEEAVKALNELLSWAHLIEELR